jgi:hypothetical protein
MINRSQVSKKVSKFNNQNLLMKSLRAFTTLILASGLFTISCKKSSCAECASPSWSFIADGNRHNGKITRTDFYYDSSGVMIVGYENTNTADTNIFSISLNTHPVLLNHTLMNISCDSVGFLYYHQQRIGDTRTDYIGYSENAGLGLKAVITNFDLTTGYLSVTFSGTVYKVENSGITNDPADVFEGYFVTKVY